jgi:hypothetical protein
LVGLKFNEKPPYADSLVIDDGADEAFGVGINFLALSSRPQKESK